MRLLVVLAGLALLGCGGDYLSAEPRRCYGATGALEFGPNPVVRGEAVELWVQWHVNEPVDDPWARILLGEGDALEVRVPLTSTDVSVYAASLVNPFGVGAPGGDGAVVVQAQGECGRLEAATAFVLE